MSYTNADIKKYHELLVKHEKIFRNNGAPAQADGLKRARELMSIPFPNLVHYTGDLISKTEYQATSVPSVPEPPKPPSKWKQRKLAEADGGWIPWEPCDDRPDFPNDVKVVVRLRSGEDCSDYPAIVSEWDWDDQGDSSIIYYRPVSPGWKVHGGGECPLPDGTRTIGAYRRVAGIPAAGPMLISELSNWQHHDRNSDIVAYKVLETSDDNSF